MGYRLLVIDDEEMIRKGILARISYLQIEFLQIREAACGQEALALLEKEPADIVLTDIRMPDMDGLSFIEEAKKKWPLMKFVVLSGYAEFEYAERSLELGVSAYLLKPLSNEALREIMEKLFVSIRKEANVRAALKEQEQLEYQKQEYLLEKEVNSLLGETEERSISREMYPVLYRLCPQMMSDGQGKFLVVIIKIDAQSYEQNWFGREDAELLRFSVKNVFDELSSSCEKVIVNNLSKKDQLYGLFYGNSTKLLKREAEHIFLEMKNLLENKMALYLTFGCSSVTEWVGEKNAREARAALQQRIVYGHSNLYFYDDMLVIQDMKLPMTEMNLLQQYLQRRDIGNIQVMIREIFSEEKVLKYHAPYIRMMWMRVLNLLIRNLGSSTNRMEVVDRMLHSFSLSEEIERIDELQEEYVRLVTECLGEEGGMDTNARNKIRMAVRYIEQHYNEDISVNELAERYDMSPNYFSSLFKKEMKQSTVNYITDLRISKAMEYLCKSDKSVVEIAKNVGYEDCNYFFRVFKKAVGVTPQQYRAGKRK
ncbi:MAG: response regulator [Lachnospiraceae bacterium]|nr:response regulator [Lachnospiraceae bacterium]